jgi:hypothetical protein
MPAAVVRLGLRVALLSLFKTAISARLQCYGLRFNVHTQLSYQLSACCAVLRYAVALQEEASMDDFQPHFKAVVQHLPQLQQVLQLQPPPKVHQSSSSDPQPAVGSHRVWACGILHMLLLHNNIIIDRAVAEAKLLPTVMAMAFRHGHCSAIQCRAVEMLRSSLRSSIQELWLGLFQPAYGQQLQQPGSDELLPPLHEGLVQIGEAMAVGMAVAPSSDGVGLYHVSSGLCSVRFR